MNNYQPRAPHPRKTIAKRRHERCFPTSCNRPADPRRNHAAPGHVGIVLEPAARTMINAYTTSFPVEVDTYGLATSKGGLSPVVGFTRPVGTH